MVREVKGKFKEKIQRTPTVVSFRFVLEERIDFLPGQFMEVILDKEDKNLRHYLSFSSAPFHDYIEFTKRISESLFCKKLNELNYNEDVLFRLPMGNCVLDDNDKKVCFIVGGIGITPVISILEDIVYNNKDIDTFLIYSNRIKEEIAFKEEIDLWQKKISLKVIYILNEEDDKKGKCIKGCIDYPFLSGYKEELRLRTNFVFGPPKMVESIKDILNRLGIEKIKWEKFIGY